MAKKARGSKATTIGALLGASAALGACAAVGAHFARRVLTPALKPDDRVRVMGFLPSPQPGDSPVGSCVWLSGPEVELEGSYSFIFDAQSRHTQDAAGHARLGPVITSTRVRGERRVLREVLSVSQGDLRVGARGRITGWWFEGPESVGGAVTTVALPMPNGVGWGWVIAPEHTEAGRWAVHVHGRGALPQETLRGVAPFLERGITNLVVTYRNDTGAPEGLGGRYGLGLAEKADVEAAIGWARSQGAERVTLVGWSMGATACVLASSGEHAGVIDGLVLESPALDWRGILSQQARLAGLPAPLATLGRWFLEWGVVRGAVPGRRGTPISALSVGTLARQIRVPTLIHASPDDTFVPWQGALRAAQHRPRLVQLRPARGEHVKLWNVDPEAWERETGKFIDTL